MKYFLFPQRPMPGLGWALVLASLTFILILAGMGAWKLYANELDYPAAAFLVPTISVFVGLLLTGLRVITGRAPDANDFR